MNPELGIPSLSGRGEGGDLMGFADFILDKSGILPFSDELIGYVPAPFAAVPERAWEALNRPNPLGETRFDQLTLTALGTALHGALATNVLVGTVGDAVDVLLSYVSTYPGTLDSEVIIGIADRPAFFGRDPLVDAVAQSMELYVRQFRFLEEVPNAVFLPRAYRFTTPGATVFTDSCSPYCFSLETPCSGAAAPPTPFMPAYAAAWRHLHRNP